MIQNKETMQDEYVIINKTALRKKIQRWEETEAECHNAPAGRFDKEYAYALRQAISTARDILSHSVPLIPEIERAFNIGVNSQFEVQEKILQIKKKLGIIIKRS